MCSQVYILSLPKYQVTGTCLEYARWHLTRKWSKTTNYLIQNIFVSLFLSLIAHELAWQIYLGFVQIGAELVELLRIIWKHPKTENFWSAPSVLPIAVTCCCRKVAGSILVVNMYLNSEQLNEAAQFLQCNKFHFHRERSSKKSKKSALVNSFCIISCPVSISQ